MTNLLKLPCRQHFLLLTVVLFTLLFATSALADYLGGITFDVESPSYLQNGQFVNISIDYKLDRMSGGLIFARPYTLGSPTPTYGASGGSAVAMGSGTTSQHFTISSAEAIVTHIRIFMTSPDQSETWLELFVPVHFVFAPHGLYNIQMDHGQFNRLPYGRALNIDFDYAADSAENVRISARPFTNGALTPGYFASGSASLPPSGSYFQNFYFNQDADVTDIRFQIWNNSFDVLLYEFFVPYDIYWREFGIYDFSFNWPDGEALHNTQNIVGTFTVEHYLAGDLRAWMWCTTGGSYSPGGVYQGSAVVPTGPQIISRYCRISSGETDVDGLEFIFGTSTDPMMQFNVPVTHHYGPHAVQNHEFVPASPAIMTHGERLNMTFDYVTDDDASVRIFSRPAYDGELLYGINSSGSLAYPPPAGSGTFWLTFNEGEHLASSMYFHMTNLDQSVVHFDQFVDGWWAWGSSGYITPAPDLVPSVLATLGPVYPNPFNPRATVPVLLQKDTSIQLGIYDLRGRLVEKLHDGDIAAGRHLFTFNGWQQPSGVYFCRLKTPAGVETRAMTLLK